MSKRGLILLAPALAALSLLGLYIGPVTLTGNGFGDASWRYVIDPPADVEAGFPGAPRPFFRDFTGLAPLDQAFAALVAYFSALLDGDVPPHVALYGVWAFCQFMPLTILLLLEGWRDGNRGRLVGWTTTLVLVGQFISLQFLYPLWVLLYLFTSPIAQSRSSSSLLLPSSLDDVALLPVTAVLVFVPLTVAMYPLPLFLSARAHYTAIAIWQLYPLWHHAAHRALAAASRVVAGHLSVVVSPAGGASDPAARRARYLAGARAVYNVVFAAGVLGQLPVLLLTVGPSLGYHIPAALEPWASSDGLAALAAVFAPRSPLDPPRVADVSALESGGLAPLAHFFLQYDMYIGCGALLIWALWLHRVAVPYRGSDVLWLLVRVMVWFGIGGFSAAVSGLLWERDWYVLDDDEDEVESEKKRV